MNNQEPTTKSTILTRPCYEANGEVFRPERPRYIGMIYVYGKKTFESSDYDNDGDAFNACANHILRYEKKHSSSYYIDAKMDMLKS